METRMEFYQGCPVCGRSLRINAQLLGSRVYCDHCGGGFLASGGIAVEGCCSEDRPASATVDNLLDKAATILQAQMVFDE
ncbi:MAG: hypothetical protein ABGW78_09370 [Pirellulales bacterium]